MIEHQILGLHFFCWFSSKKEWERKKEVIFALSNQMGKVNDANAIEIACYNEGINYSGESHVCYPHQVSIINWNLGRVAMMKNCCAIFCICRGAGALNSTDEHDLLSWITPVGWLNLLSCPAFQGKAMCLETSSGRKPPLLMLVPMSGPWLTVTCTSLSEKPCSRSLTSIQRLQTHFQGTSLSLAI